MCFYRQRSKSCSGTDVKTIVKNGTERDNGTFIVKILNRQNATWQGTVTWVEKQQTQNFRSALELLKMIDGAVSDAEEAPEEESGT